MDGHRGMSWGMLDSLFATPCGPRRVRALVDVVAIIGGNHVVSTPFEKSWQFLLSKVDVGERTGSQLRAITGSFCPA
jgi:hypothetical protein